MSDNLKGLGLFSGAGGFELGFNRAGIEIVAQCDLYDPAAIPELTKGYNDKLQAATTNEETKRIKSEWRKSIKYGADLYKLSQKHWPETLKINGVQNVKKGTIAQSIDIVFGGFPCQDISIAGHRKGLAGERSGLWFEFLRVVKKLEPRWVVIENVGGLLSSNDGRDLATIFSGLEKCGYWWAYRTLDSQHWGVPQRRRRVFIVASLTKGCPQEVLFERESSPWDTPPSREERQKTARTFTIRTGKNGGGKGYLGLEDLSMSLGGQPQFLDKSGAARPGVQGNETDFLIVAGGKVSDVSTSLTSKSRYDLETETFAISGYGEYKSSLVTLRASGGDNGGGTEGIVINPPIAQSNRGAASEITETLRSDSHGAVPMTGENSRADARRLTPLECERLQGFPDNFTRGFSDSTRYKMMGNAVTVNVVEWIGQRINALLRR